MASIVRAGGWAYGLQLPIQTLTRFQIDPWEDAATVADLVAVAQQAEATGHAFAGVCDHIAIPAAIPGDEIAAQMSTTWYDPVATLGFLAAHTRSVRLLSEVWVAGHRHPLQTASAFATLDQLSGGRVILGVGAGHLEGEFTALGTPFHERGAILDETLEALASVFHDRFVSFAGKRYHYGPVGVGPQPVSGTLTTWIGGSSRAAWRRVGRFGDGYIPMGNPLTQYGEIVDAIHESAAEHGRVDAAFDIGYMPGAAHLTGGPKDEIPPTQLYGVDAMAERIRAARRGGANVMHLKFRGRTLTEYLEQFDAFVEQVVPLVNEG
jgi:probable F420-dependent oxidoreductase